MNVLDCRMVFLRKIMIKVQVSLKVQNKVIHRLIAPSGLVYNFDEIPNKKWDCHMERAYPPGSLT